MRPFLFVVIALMLSVVALGGYERFDSNIRPATGSQQVIPEYQSVGSPALASTTAVHAAIPNTSTTAASVVTTGITNPVVPRNLTVTTGGSTGDCKAGNVTITGKNILGRTMSEDFAITDDQAGTTTGNKAFKTVTSISVPKEDSPAHCTFAIGTGSKLGINRCMSVAGDFGHATFNGVKEATAPTIAASSTAVESNTATLNSTLDGSAVKFLFYQNYLCLP
jgi:hypothetical protein